MAEAKSISNDVKRLASDAQAAGMDFTSAVASDVQQFAKDVGKSGSKVGGALQGDINDLRKDVARILVTLRKLAVQVSDDVVEGTQDTFDELSADAGKAGAAAKKSALRAAGEAEVMIAEHPLASIAIALGVGFLFSQLIRR